MTIHVLHNGIYRDPATLPATLADGQAGAVRLTPDRVLQSVWTPDDPRVQQASGNRIGVGTSTLFAVGAAGQRIGLRSLSIMAINNGPIDVESWDVGVGAPTAESFRCYVNANNGCTDCIEFWPPYFTDADCSWRLTVPALSGASVRYLAQAIYV